MKQNTAGKIVLCILQVCFFLTCISPNVFAFDESDSVLKDQGQSLDVVKIFQRFEGILNSGGDNITIDDIESMIVEINFLHEELYVSLFSMAGEGVLENDDECSAILALSSLYLLRGVNLVMSILGDMVQAGTLPQKSSAGHKHGNPIGT